MRDLSCVSFLSQHTWWFSENFLQLVGLAPLTERIKAEPRVPSCPPATGWRSSPEPTALPHPPQVKGCQGTISRTHHSLGPAAAAAAAAKRRVCGARGQLSPSGASEDVNRPPLKL